MKNLFKVGDRKTFYKIVNDADTANFDSGQVHPVYATFALGRDAEWCCRLFVLEMKEEDEEGIGTFLTIEHQSPSLVNNQVIFTATVERLTKNEIICSYEAKVGERLIAFGKQGQKILKKEKINQIFNSLIV
jgi:fluoroacetyl-CoA thioesterase